MRPFAASASAPSDPALFRAVLAATLVAACLRFFGLGHPSLWIDEIFTWMAAGGGDWPFGWRDVLGDVHGPLYTLAVHLSMRAFGEAEWALRLPSAIAGVLTVPAMAWVASRWLGRETAAPAAWLAAGSPFLQRYAQEARGYAVVMLATCASVALALELRRRFDARTVLAWLGVTLGGALSNPSFVLLAPLELRVWLGGDPVTRRSRLRTLAIAAVIMTLALAPFVPTLFATWDWSRLVPARGPVAGESPLRGSTTFHAGAVPFALHAFAVGYSLGPSLGELRAEPGGRTLVHHAGELGAVTLIFGIGALLGLAALRRRRVLLDALLWLVAPALLVAYAAGQNFKVFNPRYLAVSFPAVLLVLAAAWADRGRAGRWLLGGGIAVLWALSLHHYFFDPRYGREDYRNALDAVRRGIRPGEQVLAVGAMEPVDYYGRGLSVTRMWLGFAADSARLEARLGEALARANGTWVVLSRSEDLDPEGRFIRRMRAVAPGTEDDFPGVRVWHVVAGAGGAEAAAPPPSR